MLNYLFLAIVFMVQTLSGMNFQAFDSYQSLFTAEELELKIKTYLEKNPAGNSFYKFSSDTLYLGDLTHNQIDYVLRLAPTSQSSRPSKRSRPLPSSLQGARIAIDPGHFGGEYAELEGRCITIPAEKSPSKRPIHLEEGRLSYLTAIALKALLEKEGATVFITRPGIGKGAIQLPFFQWLEQHENLRHSHPSLSEVFPSYNRADLLARADAINRFAPDITLIIHYNAHMHEGEKEKGPLLTTANYNMTFIPGAFCANELQRVEDRYEFLRLLLTEDIEQSLQLSTKILNQFVDILKVPAVSEHQKTSYLHRACLMQRPGVYSRNLALTRLVHSPLCYGESLVQNNENEINRLSINDTEVEGHPCPSRIKEVAVAYFKGIQDYLKTFSENR